MNQKSRWLKRAMALLVVMLLGSTIFTTSNAESITGQGMGGEIIISEINGEEWSPDVAYNSVHDEYLVVWDYVAPGEIVDVYAARVSAIGQVLDVFPVASNPYNQSNPSVAYDSINDRYLVVFSYDFFGNDSDWDINGRFIPWNGPSPSLLDFGICIWNTNQMKPKVAYAYTQQEYLVTWVNNPAGQPRYVSARRVFASGGFPAGDGFTISAGTEYRDDAEVAYNLARNEYLVTWDIDRGSGDLDIMGMRLNGQGIPLLGGDPPQQIGEFTIAGWPDLEEHPAVAACRMADQYLVAWQSDVGTGGSDYAIYARYLSGDAVPGTVVLVDNTTLPQVDAANACDHAGYKYLLAWSDLYVGGEYGIWARIARTNGALDPGFELVGPKSDADRILVELAGGKTNFLATWMHDRIGGGDIDIHGRLVGYFVYIPFIKR